MPHRRSWGAKSTWTRNLECARGLAERLRTTPSAGTEIAGGVLAGRSLCRASWSRGRDRTAVGRKPLAALPRVAICTCGPCPEPLRTVRKSFRLRPPGLAEQTSKTQKQNQTQIPCTCKPPLEKTMEADISIWQKPGHFYFALTRKRTFACPALSQRERSKKKSETPDSFPFCFLRKAFFTARLSGPPHELVPTLAHLSD